MEVLRREGQKVPSPLSRRILIFACVVSLVAVIAHVGVALWAQSEFTQPEGIVASQALTLATEGTLYYDLKQYPYTICPYMPLLYGMMAAMFKLGMPILLAGRLVNIAALAAILYLIWKLLLLYTNDRRCAWTGLALGGMTQLLLGWGVVGRSDVPAIALSVAAFYFYARYAVKGDEVLDQSAILAMLGLLFKQTALAAPAAIFLLLLVSSPKRAIRFGLIVGGIGGAIVLGIDRWLDGRFLFSTVFSNMNPFGLFKMQLHFEFMAATLSPLILIAAIGAKQALASSAKSAFMYLLTASAIFLLTAGKLGSDFNYQIETAILLIVCSCLSLHSLNFFDLYAMGSKSWVTMLILPLAVFAVQNLRISTAALVDRIEGERKFRVQLRELEPFFTRPGMVLSADSNSLVHFQRRIEVDALIYRWLVEAGKVSEARVVEDIRLGNFQSILLFEDAFGEENKDPEFPRLPKSHMDMIRSHYRMVKRIPGAYPYDLFAYQPLSAQQN